MEIIFDGLLMEDESDFHKEIIRQIPKGTTYGCNLDALWDLLTGMLPRPCIISWRNSEVSKRKLARFKKIETLFFRVQDFDRRIGLEVLEVDFT